MLSYSLLKNDGVVRKGKLELGKIEEETPFAMVSDSELGHLEELQHPDTEHPTPEAGVIEVRDAWDEDNLEKLENTPQFRQSSGTKKLRNRYPYRKREHFYRPEVSDIVEEDGFTEDQAELLLKFGRDLGCDLIGLPDKHIDSAPAEYEDYLESMQKKFDDIRRGDMRMVPLFSLKTEGGDLVDKIKKAVSEGFQAIAIDCRALRGNVDALNSFRTYIKENQPEVLFMGVNCERMRSFREKPASVSVRELLPFFGFDVVSYTQSKTQVNPDKIDSVKWRVPGGSVYLGENHTNNEGFQECQLRCCNGEHPSKILSDFEPYDEENDAAWMHDTISLERDFISLRDAIENESARNFLKGKTLLRDYLEQELIVDEDE